MPFSDPIGRVEGEGYIKKAERNHRPAFHISVLYASVLRRHCFLCRTLRLGFIPAGPGDRFEVLFGRCGDRLDVEVLDQHVKDGRGSDL